MGRFVWRLRLALDLRRLGMSWSAVRFHLSGSQPGCAADDWQQAMLPAISLQQAVRALAASYDGSLLDDEHDLDDLFDAGVIGCERDFTDEYLTVLTTEGREAIRRLLIGLDSGHA